MIPILWLMVVEKKTNKRRTLDTLRQNDGVTVVHHVLQLVAIWQAPHSTWMDHVIMWNLVHNISLIWSSSFNYFLWRIFKKITNNLLRTSGSSWIWRQLPPSQITIGFNFSKYIALDTNLDLILSVSILDTQWQDDSIWTGLWAVSHNVSFRKAHLEHGTMLALWGKTPSNVPTGETDMNARSRSAAPDLQGRGWETD
jgi:hypothetical protein